MQFKSNFFKLLLLIYIVNASPSHAQQDQVVLINKSNSWEKSFFSYYSSTSSTPRTILDLVADHQIVKGQYLVEIPTQEPLFFNFSSNWKVQFVYLFPGDTLEFRLTTNDSIPFQFGGSRPYAELMFFSVLEAAKMGFVSSGNHELEVTSKLNFQYVADQTLERYKKRLIFFNEQVAKGNFTEQGKNLINQSLYYQYLGELLFPYERTKTLKESIEIHSIVPNSYKAKLRELSNEFNKDSLMYLWDYRNYIFQYARFLMLDAPGTKEVELSSLLNFYKFTFSGRIRDFLLFDEINSHFQASGDASQILEVIDSVENKSIRDTLLSFLTKSQKVFSQRALEAEMESPSGEKITLINMLSIYSHKLIYLDFWATWCGPCLMEMPESEKLLSEFKNDSIEFVYLSIDTDKQKWLRKIPKLPSGINAHHYRLADGPDFIKEMGIPSVPRYMLINKGSKMVTFNAPRPRSEAIRELISQNAGISR